VANIPSKIFRERKDDTDVTTAADMNTRIIPTEAEKTLQS